jgi:hypothetical protein
MAAAWMWVVSQLFPADPRHPVALEAHASRYAGVCRSRAGGGLSIRAVTRMFEVDPNTVLAWLVEVAAHAAAFSSYFLP